MRDFAGDWDLDRNATRLSVMDVASLDSAGLSIRMADGLFELRRTFVVEGETHEAGFTAPLDGTEAVREEPERVLRLQVHQDGGDWVFTAKIADEAGESLNTVRYRLSDDGRSLLADERFRGPALSYDNLWVFERRPQPG